MPFSTPVVNTSSRENSIPNSVYGVSGYVRSGTSNNRMNDILENNTTLTKEKLKELQTSSKSGVTKKRKATTSYKRTKKKRVYNRN